MCCLFLYLFHFKFLVEITKFEITFCLISIELRGKNVQKNGLNAENVVLIYFSLVRLLMYLIRQSECFHGMFHFVVLKRNEIKLFFSSTERLLSSHEFKCIAQQQQQNSVKFVCSPAEQVHNISSLFPGRTEKLFALKYF